MDSKSTIKTSESLSPVSHSLPLCLEEEYIKSLSKEELKTLEIAREHLESSFNLKKSIGFIKWKENKNEN
tara:strand:+ start:462 stop:671 length:210 start_codon:yes stop_codon:yes gene_type:complete